MADHPLKPAIDRRLGRPLPHQLPNLTRADPNPINLSPEGRIRYYSPFPVAIPQIWARSHALLTRPPLTPKGVCGISCSFPQLFPIDGQIPTCYSPVRHVSRNRSSDPVRLACVRHAASVRSEPGSNSQVEPSLRDRSHNKASTENRPGISLGTRSYRDAKALIGQSFLKS